MKKFKTKICFLCKGLGRIAIGENKKIRLPESEKCPLCEGKGYLNIIDKEWED